MKLFRTRFLSAIQKEWPRIFRVVIETPLAEKSLTMSMTLFWKRLRSIMLRNDAKSEPRPCNSPRIVVSGMVRDDRNAARAGNFANPSRSDLRIDGRSARRLSDNRRTLFGVWRVRGSGEYAVTTSPSPRARLTPEKLVDMIRVAAL